MIISLVFNICLIFIFYTCIYLFNWNDVDEKIFLFELT